MEEALKKRRRKKRLKYTDEVVEFESEECEHLVKRLIYLEAFDFERHLRLGQVIHNRTGWRRYVR